jgi:hypothetical protein
MTPTNWIAIASIIAASMTSVAVAIISARSKSRSDQPSPTPAASQPISRIQRIGGWFSRCVVSPWSQVLLMFINLYNLVWQMRSPKPLNRWGVLLIALPVAGIVLNFAALQFYALLRNQSDQFRILLNLFKDGVAKQHELNHGLLDLIDHVSKSGSTADREILDLTQKIIEHANLLTAVAVGTPPTAKDRPAQDTFDRLRNAIKRLLE